MDVPQTFIRTPGDPASTIWGAKMLGFLFFGLSKKRKKKCAFCDTLTINECKRCGRPMCDKHTKRLEGSGGLRWEVCPECHVSRRGKVRTSKR